MYGESPLTLQFCRRPASTDAFPRRAPARRHRAKATKILTEKLGREPTPEEVAKKVKALKKKEAEAVGGTAADPAKTQKAGSKNAGSSKKAGNKKAGGPKKEGSVPLPIQKPVHCEPSLIMDQKWAHFGRPCSLGCQWLA